MLITQKRGYDMGLFKTYSEKQIKKIIPIVDKIEALADKFKAMSSEELRKYTDKLKADLADGKTLDDILPEAFALVREADDRVLGKRPFRVQLMGGILLHQGRIAEMKTGEGKTLVATLPAYLNALSGKGVHIVTVNDYLARRDSEEMGKVYAFLGLTTGLIVHDQSREEKRAAYAADITYATNNELGFDYLRDNMAVYKEMLVGRGQNYAIIDEVDSILIDEARTPLIISGDSDEDTGLYQRANECVKKFTKYVVTEIDDKKFNHDRPEDYIVDEKSRTAVLTENGEKKAQDYFKIENLYDPENVEILHHVTTAIKAHGVMKCDQDYIKKDGEILIIDPFTGRLMPGRRYSDGLHQAIEAKEHVVIQKETHTVATITFQNYFRMYSKLSGMTGTALTEDNEFRQIYALDVVEVPTNKPMIRIDRDDAVFTTYRGKINAIINQIKECNKKGQPVLVGTVSVEKSEEISKILTKNGIQHKVLNAKHHEKEADIVAQAGKLGTVTIATNMAGRGTDIMLGGNPEYLAKREMQKLGFTQELIALASGSAYTDDEEILKARATFKDLYERFKEQIRPEAEEVRKAGGLFILGTERHDSRRIDNQLRGRSGRQGDPGESRFYLSLDDDLFRLFAPESVLMMLKRLGVDENEPISARLLTKTIENAQKRREADNFSRRKHVLVYDDVMNQQRQFIYDERTHILTEENIQAKIEDMITRSVMEAFDEHLDTDEPNFEGFRMRYLGLLTDENDFNYTKEELDKKDRDAWRDELVERALAIYHSKDSIFDNAGFPAGAMREIEKNALLTSIDKLWMEHLDVMEELKSYVGLNAYAQRDPVTMYRIQGSEIFDQLISDIRELTVRRVLSVMPKSASSERKQVADNISAGFAGGRRQAPAAPAKAVKVERNAPCPCGSGKKYKKCCELKNRQGQ